MYPCCADQMTDAIEAVRGHLGPEPVDLAIVLGSGLGGIADDLKMAADWEYSEFPCFPSGEVAGHAGRLYAGTMDGRRVLLFQGRFHLYQGFSAHQTTVCVRMAHALGCKRVLLTNAVGGIHPDLVPGRFMFVTDHINLLGDNPLRGFGDDAFIDLTSLYRTELFEPLQKAAHDRGISLLRGVLAALPGPSYETPAEVRALQILGADAVSMSLVPEAVMAGFLGMEVVGLSCTANRAAGLGLGRLCHDEVLGAGRRGTATLSVLVELLASFWFA